MRERLLPMNDRLIELMKAMDWRQADVAKMIETASGNVSEIIAKQRYVPLGAVVTLEDHYGVAWRYMRYGELAGIADLDMRNAVAKYRPRAVRYLVQNPHTSQFITGTKGEFSDMLGARDFLTEKKAKAEISKRGLRGFRVWSYRPFAQ